ncbi:hypothetical protein Bbelb_199870, partial [Branchiostoma belcheri]
KMVLLLLLCGRERLYVDACESKRTYEPRPRDLFPWQPSPMATITVATISQPTNQP